jgi:hypothetical protein
MSGRKVAQRVTVSDSQEAPAVSGRAVTRFSRWLNLAVTKSLRSFEGKWELVVDLVHRDQTLGALALRRAKNGKIVVQASFNGTVVLYLAEVKNHNATEFSAKNFKPVRACGGSYTLV